MSVYIQENYEFGEVVNQFPILKEKLENLHFKLDIVEGESVHDFFEKNSLSEEEIDLIVKRLNRELTTYLTKKNEQSVEIETVEAQIPISVESSKEEE